ncbi:MAG: histidine kinase [Sphingobacteriales bacterium]|nr:MAG: histidine kinase [Sphingobacteriales bacterium]
MHLVKRPLWIFVIATATFLLMPLFFEPGPPGPHGPRRHHEDVFLIKDFLGRLLLAGYFYLNFLILIPRLYFSKRIFGYACCCLVAYLLISYLPALMVDLPRPQGRPHHPWGFLLGNLGHTFFGFVAITLLALAARIHLRWRSTEQSQLTAQLSYLKAQVNPHFLFNTLHSIYSLSIEKSDKTPEAILRLSDMMRYVLSDTEKELVPLAEEIKYLTDYIGLQELRLSQSTKIEYGVTGDPEGRFLAPLVLIPFVENAFKHGSSPEEPSLIRIMINISSDYLSFDIQNNKVARQTNTIKTCIGLENAKKRLELIYPGTHWLVIKEDAGLFTVNLKINC